MLNATLCRFSSSFPRRTCVVGARGESTAGEHRTRARRLERGCGQRCDSRARGRVRERLVEAAPARQRRRACRVRFLERGGGRRRRRALEDGAARAQLGARVQRAERPAHYTLGARAARGARRRVRVRAPRGRHGALPRERHRRAGRQRAPQVRRRAHGAAGYACAYTVTVQYSRGKQFSCQFKWQKIFI